MYLLPSGFKPPLELKKMWETKQCFYCKTPIEKKWWAIVVKNTDKETWKKQAYFHIICWGHYFKEEILKKDLT